ncbi:unnamed protein product [Trifolium pratense]|uniref:Uncharacterized protein n=1 Tax=Trifolium pratense TaxID=57577 RepID=A0ACB0LVU6_TRIPR|nr:unnamed protein product [Trifolium pratense]
MSNSLVSKLQLCRQASYPLAGGFVDARGYVAALALGAQGICVGSSLLIMYDPSFANPLYKRKVIKLDETEYTDVFGRARWPGAPHRVLKTPFFMEWRSLPTHESEANKPFIGHSTIHGVFLLSDKEASRKGRTYNTTKLLVDCKISSSLVKMAKMQANLSQFTEE